jgi:hypothetical protein
MQYFYPILIGLGVWLVSRKVLPPAINWFLGLWEPSDHDLDKAAAERVELKHLAETDADAAQRVLQSHRKRLRALQAVKPNPDEPPAIRELRVKARQEALSEMQELERRMLNKGWLSPSVLAKPARPSQYDGDTLKEDLAGVFMMGGIYALIAAVPLGLYELYAILMHVIESPDAPPLRQMIGFPAIVFIGYAFAALGAGLAIFLLRPLRRWALGWMLSGSVIAAMVYGGVGLAGVLGYLWFEVNIFDLEPDTDVWQMQLFIMAFVALFGAPAGLYFRSQEGE